MVSRAFLFVAGCLLLPSDFALGRNPQDDREAQCVELAQDCAVDLVALSNDLPNRWMAVQKRESVDTGKIDAFKMFTSSVFEIMASDAKSGVRYTLVTSGDDSVTDKPQRTDLMEMSVQTHIRQDLILHRVQPEDWKAYPKVPNIGGFPTIPFHWCLGLLNSAKSGSMMANDYLTILWRFRKECLVAFKENDDLVSFWGFEGKQPYVFKVNFDQKTRLIKEYALLQTHKEVVSKEARRQKKYSVIEHGTVKWKVFPKLRGDDKSDLPVPVFVKILSTMNPGEEIECTNEIEWKFGSDVPDSIFADPRTPQFRLPF